MKKLVTILSFVWAVVTNRYEGGQRWSTGRSYLPGFVQDARYDADPMAREEMVRKSRYWEQNSGIVNRLADLFEQYTVGPNGLQFIPASSNEPWNQLNAAAWAGWCAHCDLVTRQSFATLQSLVARAWFVDGEIFLLKTSGANTVFLKGQPVQRPRIQLIESHRVSTPSTLAAQEGHTIIEGIEIDPRGRPVAYHVQDGFAETTWRRIPADQIIHVFEPARAGQYRGLPFLYPVLNDLHDLEDLQMLEMQAAKKNAAVANVIENAAGELSGEQMRRERFSQPTQKTNGTDTLETRVAHIQQVTGSRTVALKTGEKLQVVTSDRPGVAQREHWDYMTSKICAGVGISKLLVFPWSMQGTVTRADLDVANAFFRSRSSVLQGAFTEIYLWVTEWNLQNAPGLAAMPLNSADWRNVTTRAPRSVNVDVGRNAAALIAEYAAGWRTLESICAELGEDWRNVLRQRAKEMRAAMDLEKEFSLPAGSLVKAVLESIIAEANAAAAQKAAETAAAAPGVPA